MREAIRDLLVEAISRGGKELDGEALPDLSMRRLVILANAGIHGRNCPVNQRLLCKLLAQTMDPRVREDDKDYCGWKRSQASDARTAQQFSELSKRLAYNQTQRSFKKRLGPQVSIFLIPTPACKIGCQIIHKAFDGGRWHQAPA
jgi:hypothetical protein